MSKEKPLPPRPKHPGRYGVSDVLGYLKELEKWAELAEKRLILRGEVEEDDPTSTYRQRNVLG